VVVIGALATYWWGVKAGTKFLRNHETLLQTLKSREGDDVTDAEVSTA
jgi:membrane protein DedA with SNARE-associated domain